MTIASEGVPRTAGRVVRVGPVNLDALTDAEVVEVVRQGWRDGRGGHIVTPNVDIVRRVARDPDAARLVAGATLTVADGMPLVWASRVQGQALPERVPGSSLVFSLSQAAAADGRSVFLIGGDPGVPETAARALAARYPGLTVVGTDSPPFGFEQSEAEVTRIVDALVAADPDLVLVGLGFPKQERLIERLREAVPGAWYLGCGAGIAMAAGQFRRAPIALQRLGLEWVHRLVLEPRRLARRYLRHSLPYALGLLAFASVHRLVPALRPPPESPGVVCFSAQDWWYHNQSHSDFHLMRRIAHTQRVLVVNSIGMRMPLPGRSTEVTRRILRKLRSVAMLVRRPLPELPNFYVMSPLPLPFYSRRWLRWLGAVLVRVQVRGVAALLGLRAPIIVTTLPTAWDVVRPMRRRALVFNRSDRHSEFPESDRATIEALEQKLLRGADHVVYVSRALMAQECELTGERAHFLDHGVDIEHFRPRPPEELPPDLAAIATPRVGFFGALDDYLVDFDLLERVAAELPDVSLVLIGAATADMERFDKYPNVHHLGRRPYEQIPAYGSGFDVALMPWLDNSWIQHANPIKLKEYLALGLPIVSTAFAEVEHYRDRVRVAGDHADFVDLIRESLADGGLCDPISLRRSVLDSSWEARAAELLSLVERGMPLVEHRIPLGEHSPETGS